MKSNSRNPEKKLVIDMLRIMNRYAGECSSRSLDEKPVRNPLNISFEFDEDAAANQRCHQRVQFPGEVNLNKANQFIVGNCLNISASGMYMTCETADFVRVHDHVHLIIRLDDQNEIFRTPARVIREDRGGYALEFVTL
jgi:hypothetical protein